MNTKRFGEIGGSFRDPSGFMLRRQGRLARLIRPVYREHYERLMTSGLYEELRDAGRLIPHREIAVTDADRTQYGEIYRMLEPETIPFISYPYEWGFGQLQAAALALLDIQRRSLARGMILKDAPAWNMQFIGGRPVLADTLSFEIYRNGEPWQAYRQFCQHFLLPLLLWRQDYRLTELLLYEIDGIPLDTGSRLLSWRSWLSPGVLLHVHLHALAQRRYANVKTSSGRSSGLSRNGMLGLIDQLHSLIAGLTWKLPPTEWGDYYHRHNYSPTALTAKEQIVGTMLKDAPSGVVWDFGANDGRFSDLAAAAGHYTVSMDIDPAAVEHNYRNHRDADLVLPLRIDLRNESPGNGWDGRERLSLTERGPAETALALALIHHLAIANNVPLSRLADWFADRCRRLIIEFVPREDSMAQRLLQNRDAADFADYDLPHFEAAFACRFTIRHREFVPESTRVIYTLDRRNENE